jgi:DNA-binding transcriptional LysR family regulator
VLAYTGESGLGRIMQAGVGAKLAQSPVRTVFTAHLASVLRTMALDGRGIAWLPRSLIDEDLARGRLVAAASAEWDVPLEIRLYRDAQVLGQAAEAFWTVAADC